MPQATSTAPVSLPAAATILNTPIGPLSLHATPRGLRSLHFLNAPPSTPPPPTDPATAPILTTAAAQLTAYFAGALREFTVALDLAGTPFQLRVWDRLLAIPYGHTISYRTLAADIGAPAAVRAVGGANGANLIAIIVPCHRVIAHDGTLGGYGGGLERKRFLLDLEGASTHAPLFGP